MLRNYFIVAFRNLLRNKTASMIKVTSLAVGMICFAIISLFVNHELSYDRFHENPEQIYRVVKDFINDDGSAIPDATTPPAMAPAMWNELPEIASATRVFPNWGRKYLMEAGDVRMYEEKLIRIDSSFFDVFSFQFVKGDKSSSLANLNFILLTESAAKRYFRNEDPIGKAIKIDIGQNGTDFFVSGILKDIPENSHFDFDFLISIRSFQYAGLDTDWGWYNFYTYARLKPETDPALFNAKLPELFKRHNPENENRYYSQVITDIHLKSNLKWELKPNGDASYIKILSTIAVFVVILAAINYINLVTAQSAKRAKEVGIRKVSGAGHSLLVRQFMLESVILSLVATLISIAAAEALLPLFRDLFSTSLSFFDPQNQIVLWMAAGAGVITGLLAGIYPALYLSSFKAVSVLKGAFTQTTGGNFLRKGLVTFQFMISTILIISALVISGQIDFIRTKNLGFEKENILMINNAGRLQNREALLTEIKKINGVSNAGGSNGVLGGQNWTTGLRTEDRENSLLLNFLSIDYDFLNVMGVNFKEGRNFAREHGTDSSAIILNETAVKQLGLSEPVVGRRVVTGTDDNNNPIYGTVIGVITDFHFTSFHDPIKPFGFFLLENNVNILFVKINGDNLQGSINDIKQTWSKLVPNRPFEFTFQDEQVAKLYSNEQRFQKLFSYFTLVAIVIACLGLLGLSAFTAQQRTKEIGIRKVLGASVMGITQLLSRDFMKLIVIAIVLSTPIAWYMMDRWLQSFAYRITINGWIFVLAALMAIGIALFTISFQSIKAALANPVDSLRNE
ncbi:MAG TPA: ABC transporter permease [Cyclobacteriaceae bacterium]|nr:ABC transporter permease [Cyclobacteriaceae bacterium]